MLQVLVVGDHNSGKTTFLGLLYATQVRSGSDETDTSRFHASPESLEAMAPVFQQLMSGSFPDSASKEGLKEMDFQLRSRRSHGGLSPLLGRRRSPAGSSAVHITLFRTPLEEIPRLLRGSSIVDKTLNSIYQTDVIVILVASTELTGPGDRPDTSPLSSYDRGVDPLLGTIQQLGEPKRHRRLHPIFVFTKFDRVRPDVLHACGVDARPPEFDEGRRRASYAENLLAPNLPTTFARIRAHPGEGIRIADPIYLFSWVRIEEPVPGQPERIQLRPTQGAGWAPDYPVQEYQAFLRWLGRIAAGRGE